MSIRSSIGKSRKPRRLILDSPIVSAILAKEPACIAMVVVLIEVRKDV